jgi:hypothetical protein
MTQVGNDFPGPGPGCSLERERAGFDFGPNGSLERGTR